MPTSELLRSLSLLWSMFHILIIFMVLYQSRFDRRKTFLYTTAFMGPLVLLVGLGVIFFGPETMGRLLLLTCTLPSLVFFYLISEDRSGKFFFTFCFSDTVAYWIIIVTNLLDRFLTGESCVVMLISRLIAFPLTEYLTWRYVRPVYRQLQKTVQRGWWLAAGLSAGFYLLLVVMSNYPTLITKRPEDIPALILACVIMPLCYLLIFFALHQQMQILKAQQEDHSLAEQKKLLEARLENQETLRRMNHDLRAYTTTLSGLLQAQQYEEAAQVAAAMNQASQRSDIQICTDPYLNAVLSQFVPQFSRLGVPLKADIRLDGSRVPGVELSLILVNALENALTATEALSPESRSASVQLRRRGEYLLLRVKNACDSGLYIEPGQLPPSTKTEPGHGYGLATIRRIAEDLNGNAVCYIEDGKFVLDVNLRSE